MLHSLPLEEVVIWKCSWEDCAGCFLEVTMVPSTLTVGTVTVESCPGLYP